MTRFNISIDINASTERTWAILRDAERWPEWTPTVTGVELLDPGPLRVGTRAMIRQPKLPPALFEVTELDEGRSFTWVTGNAFVKVAARHSVEPIATGSRLELSLRFSGAMGAVAGWLTRKLNRSYLEIEANGLKARAESGGPT